jgi:predicted Zn-dependent protease
MYTITRYSYQKAKELNVTIKPSKNKTKKIDVYKNGELVASIGAIGYKDYPTYIKEYGLEYANKRRQLYRIRHKNDLTNKSGNGYWANKILW